MKKFLLLAVAAGLMFGECVKEEDTDKMTDETKIYFTCTSSDNTGTLFIGADENGKPNYVYCNENEFYSSPIGESPKLTLSKISFVTADFLDFESDSGQKARLRLDKKEAFSTRMSVDGRWGFFHRLSKKEMDAFKNANKLLIEYETLIDGTKYLEFDISGLKKFQ